MTTLGSDILVPTVHGTPDGLRLVHIADSCSRVGIFGVCVRAGSANETEGNFGLAHFVEHTIFKGTPSRDAMSILNHMELVGGELNAYTTNEATVIYSIFPAQYSGRAIDLIADLVINSSFPKAELKREKDVVLDEINSYLDSPADAIYDTFEDKIFAGSGYGHNILGTCRSVRSFNTQTCRTFLDTYYRAPNMTAFYCGPGSASEILDCTAAAFKNLDSRQVEVPHPVATVAPQFSHRRSLPVHQAHVLLGTVLPCPTPEHRYAASLFANIVGGPGMNSLFNIELRERRGLVYNVEASSTFLADGNCLLTVYFGCDESDRRECLHICNDVLGSVSSGEALAGDALQRAATQYLGQLTVAVENRENRIIAAARSTLFHGAPLADEAVRNGIAAVSGNDVSRVAESMLNYSSLFFVPKK